MKKNKYDFLILGNSRLGFLASKNNYYKIFTHFDNVEYDYCYSVFQGAKGIKKILFQIEKISVMRDEKKALFNSEKILCLSKRDEDRLRALYHYNGLVSIFPVCIEGNKPLQESSERKLIFVGSLNYTSNIEAVKNFIPVFLEQTACRKFVVAGSNPSKEIEELIKKHKNIILKANFKDYSEIANKGDILVSFIKIGSGMKVKVAEAMSMGLLVCGTDETFVGYEEALSCESGLFICNNGEQFIQTLNNIAQKSEKLILDLAERNISLFKQYYSLTRSDEILFNLLN